MARYECEQCGYEREVDDALIGQEATCPACEVVNVVVDAVDAPAMPEFVVSQPAAAAPAPPACGRNGVFEGVFSYAQGATGFKLLAFAILSVPLGVGLTIFLEIFGRVYAAGEVIVWLGALVSFVLLLMGIIQLAGASRDNAWRGPCWQMLWILLPVFGLFIMQATMLMLVKKIAARRADSRLVRFVGTCYTFYGINIAALISIPFSFYMMLVAGLSDGRHGTEGEILFFGAAGLMLLFAVMLASALFRASAMCKRAAKGDHNDTIDE